MKPHFAIAKRTDGLAVFLDIADEKNLGVNLLHALRAVAQRIGRRLAVSQWPEPLSKTQLIVFADILSAKHQNEIVVPGLLYKTEFGIVNLTREINALDHSAAATLKRNDSHAHFVSHRVSSRLACRLRLLRPWWQVRTRCEETQS